MILQHLTLTRFHASLVERRQRARECRVEERDARVDGRRVGHGGGGEQLGHAGDLERVNQ